MRKSVFILGILFILLGTRTLSASENSHPVYIAWWNVENLFDTVDDATHNDAEFTPDSKKHWTPQRLEAKLQGMTRVLSCMNDSAGPDILGMAEVENRQVLSHWVHKYLGDKYGIAYHESPDLRGIDVALIYRKSMFQHVGTAARRVKLGKEDRPTRDIVDYVLVRDGDSLDCVTVHWPSRYGGKEASEPKRIMAAKATESVVDSLYRVRTNDDIVVMGDFNDEPGDISITNYLRASDTVPTTNQRHNLFLLDALYPVYADSTQGTYYYHRQWDTLDQLLLSRGMLDQTGFGTASPWGNVFVRPFMQEASGKYKGAPFRTYVGSRYLGGISDHFPVYIIVNHYSTSVSP